jgi:hypothetical protein
MGPAFPIGSNNHAIYTYKTATNTALFNSTPNCYILWSVLVSVFFLFILLLSLSLYIYSPTQSLYYNPKKKKKCIIYTTIYYLKDLYHPLHLRIHLPVLQQMINSPQYLPVNIRLVKYCQIQNYYALLNAFFERHGLMKVYYLLKPLHN